jgi:hypothetical protein
MDLEKYIASNYLKVIDRIIRKRGGDQTMVYKRQIIFFEFLAKIYILLELFIILARIMKLTGVICISLFLVKGSC